MVSTGFLPASKRSLSVTVRADLRFYSFRWIRRGDSVTTESEILRELEWSAYDEYWYGEKCPMCGIGKSAHNDHFPGCKLGQALGRPVYVPAVTPSKLPTTDRQQQAFFSRQLDASVAENAKFVLIKKRD